MDTQSQIFQEPWKGTWVAFSNPFINSEQSPRIFKSKQNFTPSIYKPSFPVSISLYYPQLQQCWESQLLAWCSHICMSCSFLHLNSVLTWLWLLFLQVSLHRLAGLFPITLPKGGFRWVVSSADTQPSEHPMNFFQHNMEGILQISIYLYVFSISFYLRNTLDHNMLLYYILYYRYMLHIPLRYIIAPSMLCTCAISWT